MKRIITIWHVEVLGAELKKAEVGWEGRRGGQKSRWRLDQAQAAQAQYESFITYYVIFKKAVEIKDVFGNSGKRFKKINTR